MEEERKEASPLQQTPRRHRFGIQQPTSRLSKNTLPRSYAEDELSVKEALAGKDR